MKIALEFLDSDSRFKGAVRLSHFTTAVLLALIILLGFYVRYLYWCQNGGLQQDYMSWANEHYFGGVASRYIGIARAILDTLFQIGQLPGAESIPDSIGRLHQSISYPPGYAFFLSALWIVGAKSLQAMRLAQGFCDCLAIIPLFYLLRKLRVAQLIALSGCLFYAVSPWWAQGSIYPMAEAVLPAGVICVLALMARCARRRSLASWFGLGVTASTLSLVRPDMILLCGPIAIWALITVERSRRWLAVASCLAGFAVLPTCWGTFNLVKRGTFVITTNAGSYALWSGLGQIPNPYGYVVSDPLASEKMQRLGIVWHSKEMNDYFRREYLNAWAQHPLHVLATVAKRFDIIALEVDYGNNASSLLIYLGEFGLIALTFAIASLLSARRYADAFLVAGPLGYALASLGFVYVETRYVRFASLSYLLAEALVLQWAAQRLTRFGVRTGLATSGIAASSTVGLLVAGGLTLVQLLQIDKALVVQLAAESNSASAFSPISVWRNAVPGVQRENRANGGFSLTTSSGASQYQLMADIPLKPIVSYLAVRVRAVVKSGGLYIGILAKDGSKFLAAQSVAGTSTSDLVIVAPVHTDAVHLVIANNRPPMDSGRSVAVIKSVGFVTICERSEGALEKIKDAFLPVAHPGACPR